jgi:hypothetical protein
MRSPIGTLGGGGILTSTFYGTTHELTFNLGNVEANFMLPSYRLSSDLAYTECAVVDHWLWRARQRAMNSMNWDSGYTGDTPVQDDPPNLSALRDRQTMDSYVDFRFRAFAVVSTKEISDRYEKLYGPQRGSGRIVKTLDQARDEIERDLTEEKIQAEIDNFIDRLVDQPGTEIVILNPV